MDISLDPKDQGKTTFDFINGGDVFMYNHNYWVKAWGNRACRLYTGEIMSFSPDEQIVAYTSTVTLAIRTDV